MNNCEGLKIAYIGTAATIVGSILLFVSSQQTINAQKEISIIQVEMQKKVEKNKLVFEREKILTEYIIKNAKKFNSLEQEQMIQLLNQNNINRLTMSLTLFIVQSNSNIQQRERIYQIAKKSLQKNHIHQTMKVEKSPVSPTNLANQQAIPDTAIRNVLNDIMNAYNDDTILPNKCFSPVPVYAIKSTIMYSDAEMKNELKLIYPNTKVILLESSDHSFIGKLESKEGYFRIADFKQSIF